MTNDASPIRIQRKRTKGWEMPENTVYVGRGSHWGNPFKIGKNVLEPGKWEILLNREAAVACHKAWVTLSNNTLDLTLLKGKNLACWCKLSDPCHEDVLLEIANDK